MTGDELWRAGRSLAESRVAFRSDELTETTHLKRAIFLDGFHPESKRSYTTLDGNPRNQ